MGSIKYDVIFCDIHMPFVNGEQVARMLRSTTNPNQGTPSEPTPLFSARHKLTFF